MGILSRFDFEDNTSNDDFRNLSVHSGALDPGYGGLTQQDVLWSQSAASRLGSKGGFALLEPEHPAWKTTLGYRTEFHYGNTDPSTGLPWLGVLADKPTRWFNFSFFLPTDWDQGVNSTWNRRYIWQLHRGPGGAGSPIYAISISSDKTLLEFTYKDGASNIHTLFTTSITPAEQQWMDWTMKFKFSLDADGTQDVWLNGVSALSQSSLQTYWYNDTNIGYLKTGIYGQPTKIYFDEIRLGDANSSLEEMRPSGVVLEPSAALTGTAEPSLTEAEVVTGGKTVIITLTNDTWISL